MIANFWWILDLKATLNPLSVNRSSVLCKAAWSFGLKSFFGRVMTITRIFLPTEIFKCCIIWWVRLFLINGLTIAISFLAVMISWLKTGKKLSAVDVTMNENGKLVRNATTRDYNKASLIPIYYENNYILVGKQCAGLFGMTKEQIEEYCQPKKAKQRKIALQKKRTKKKKRTKQKNEAI